MSKTDYLDDAEVAEILRIKPITLRKRRSLGKDHPPFIKVRGVVLYPRRELEKWLRDLPLHVEIKAG